MLSITREYVLYHLCSRGGGRGGFSEAPAAGVSPHQRQTVRATGHGGGCHGIGAVVVVVVMFVAVGDCHRQAFAS